MNAVGEQMGCVGVPQIVAALPLCLDNY